MTPPTADTTVNADTEFVTVGVAAKRLSVADRTAQRYAAKLSDSDRQVSDNGGPQKVRLSAMEAKAKEAAARTVASGVRQGDGQVSDSDAPRDGQVSDAATSKEGDAQAALVAGLQGEVAFLRDALKAEQANTRAALDELTRTREQSAVLLAAVGTNRLQINAATTVENGTANEGELQKASQAAAHENATGDGGNVEVTPARGFWARLFGSKANR